MSQIGKYVCETADNGQTVFRVDNKWHFSFDPYDESTSPTEAGYYRVIDEYGTEMVDYFFGKPTITPRGIGYWAKCENVIIGWSKLEITE